LSGLGLDLEEASLSPDRAERREERSVEEREGSSLSSFEGATLMDLLMELRLGELEEELGAMDFMRRTRLG